MPPRDLHEDRRVRHHHRSVTQQFLPDGSHDPILVEMGTFNYKYHVGKLAVQRRTGTEEEAARILNSGFVGTDIRYGMYGESADRSRHHDPPAFTCNYSLYIAFLL